MKTLFFTILIGQFFCNLGFTSTNFGGGPKSLEYFGTGTGSYKTPVFFGNGNMARSTNGGGGPKALDYFGNENSVHSIFSNSSNSGFDSISFEKALDILTELEQQSSRLEFLLKTNSSTEESQEELKDEQYLKNKKEFKNALELLEKGETEAVLEDGTVIPLLKMVIEYANSNFIYK